MVLTASRTLLETTAFDKDYLMRTTSFFQQLLSCVLVSCSVPILQSDALKAQGQPARVRLSGIVSDPARAVLAGVDLELHQIGGPAILRTTTSTQGTFLFGEVEAGLYRLRAAKSGFIPVTIAPIRLYSEFDVALQLPFDLLAIEGTRVSECGSVTGVVVERDRPVVDAEVCVHRNGKPLACTQTDRTGFYFLESLVGPEVLVVRIGGRVAHTERLTLTDASDLVRHIILRK